MNANRRTRISAIITRLYEVEDILRDINDEITSVREDEEEALDNLPESLQESERGEAMREAVENLEAAEIYYDDFIREIVDALESVAE